MTTAGKLDAIQADLIDEYRAHHQHPWVVAFSGGKDSTLLLQLVCEALLTLAPSKRTRPVWVVSNDTLVESPLVITHLDKQLELIGEVLAQRRLPVKVHKTTPPVMQTFWVNVIGRGYPPPNRRFRWCTDRLKIQPTSDFIKAKVSEAGKVILLVGVRRAESAARAQSVERHTVEGQRLNPHDDLKGCMVYRPIVELITEEVWEILMQRPSPWGGRHRDLITLYRNAQGGECPTVIDRDQAPSCGTSSPRFGCWTCTVVEKDSSAEALVDAGFEHLAPLVEFRDWLKQIQWDATRRQVVKRNGAVSLTELEDGTLRTNLGPFTLATRHELLTRLLAVQSDLGQRLISDKEIDAIKRIWAEDAVASCERTLALYEDDVR